MRPNPLFLFLFLFLATAVPAAGANSGTEGSPFEIPDPVVTASFSRTADMPIPAGVRVVDFDPSPGGAEVAVLLKPRSGKGEMGLWIWKPGGPAPAPVWTAPSGWEVTSVTWHPARRALFVLATENNTSLIARLESVAAGSWAPTVIHRSRARLRRLVAGPRPFVTGYSEGASPQQIRKYRLFFGLATSRGAWAIHSVTEEGKREYQVAGPQETQTALDKSEDASPGGFLTPSALPLSFHPAGHILIFQDEKNAFHAIHYGAMNWEESRPLFGGEFSSGTVTALPNGMGVLSWKSSAPGVTVVTFGGSFSQLLAGGETFVSTPSLMPDGKALVGLTRSSKDGPETLRSLPVSIPLADVFNAWMFTESPEDVPLLERHGGLFRRPASSLEQLFEFYETELYSCGGYAETTPTRPYLVTTDALWEVWAAAYEGLFLLRERMDAIPAFWLFVDSAASELEKQAPLSRVAKLFTAARSSRDPLTPNDEARRMRAHAGLAVSSVLSETFDFGELKPRGHYTTKPAFRDYFTAMHYLTVLLPRIKENEVFSRLSPGTKSAAIRWIQAYEPFIAPSRSPHLFGESAKPRPWIRHPGREALLFPLAWGFDNEILDSTVFHASWPEAEQVKGSGGPRLVPSGLDVAAGFGSRLARTLLSSEMAKYPSLLRALDQLAARRPSGAPTLYERWLAGLGAQWADDALSAVPEPARGLWGVKRLQTGLASWATLRHATVLVNERTEAECGEGGFEELILRPPRGFVEPDPRTFEAIALLFEDAIKLVENGGPLGGKLPASSYEQDAAPQALQAGLLKRLRDSAAKARLFSAMAAKQIRGEPLTPKEYEEILFVGRVAEHHFLVYKSLANENLALSTPDPMPKVVDVAGGGPVPLLLAAVGTPLEFNLIVPSGGRRQVVRGVSYAYHEWASRKVMDDAEWRKRAGSSPLMPWVLPYLSKGTLSCPAKAPF